MKAAASVALLAALASACTMPRNGATLLMASGAALSLGGMAKVADSDVDSDLDGVNENPLNDDWDAAFGGTLLVLTGVALIVAGATSRAPVEATSSAVATPVRARPASVTWTPDVMPFDYVPGGAPLTTVETPPPPPRASLPEVATTDVVLRMAQQARAAVERGNCEAAWSTWAAVNARDARYAEALAAGAVFAPCPRVADATAPATAPR